MPSSPVVRFRSAVLTLLIALFAAIPAQARQVVVRDGFADESVATTIVAPSALAVVPDGRLLIASQYGRLYVYRDGSLRDPAALDLSDRICAYRERGLVGLAVDPQFSDNHYIYLSYSFNKFGNCESEEGDRPVGRVVRFTLGDDDVVDPATERVLIDNVQSPIGVHNLDDVEFGRDGYLYVSVGDGGCDWRGDSGCFESNNAARDLSGLNGKLLRITRDGDIPPGNPFTGADSVKCGTTGYTDPELKCQEILAYGLRNPWRIVFDPNAAATRFFINDVGQDTWEEINEGIAGADYGWNIREGFCVTGSTTDCSPVAPEGLTNPIFSYDHSDGCSSVTGGAFVPAGVWPSEYEGTYIFSDYVCGTIFLLRRQDDGSYLRETFATSLGNSSAVDMVFAPTDSGIALYYTSYLGDGEVRRIRFVGGSNRKPTAVATATPTSGLLPLTVTFDAGGSTDPDGDALKYSWDFGDGSTAEGVAVQHTYVTAGAFTATVVVTDSGGASDTASIRIDAGNTAPRPIIDTPSAAATFAVGDPIVLHGSAHDDEDGDLPPSQLTWVVLLHHNTHTHGFLPPTVGNDITFHAPGPENLEAAATSYLEIHLTATDSGGASSTVTQSFMPRTSQLTFASAPSGAQLRIDNADVKTPVTVRSWVNFGVEVDAAEPQPPDTANLTFTSWSDGGAARHVITTPADNTSYTAQFTSFAAGTALLPGRIEAENFDNGGEGVGYHDLSPGNEGGQYRKTEDVDIAATGDTGGGYVVGWTSAGEWLAYTVNVAAAGTYTFSTRVASDGQGGTFHIAIDGVDRTGPLTVPGTGGWDAWTTVTRSGVSLTAGTHVLQLVMDSNGATGAVGNFNYIQVSTASGGTPYRGVAAQLPGTIEAENFDEGGEGAGYHDLSLGNEGGQYRNTEDVDIAATGDAGGGFVVGWAGAGEWLQYSVNVTTAGIFDIDFRVASAGAGGTFHLEVNGVDVTGPMTVPDTGGWDTWVNVRKSAVALSAGPQVWRLALDTEGPTGAVGNFNYIRASAVGSSGGGSTPFGGTSATLPGILQAVNFDEGGERVAYHDLSPGNSGGQYRPTEDVDIAGTTDGGAGYVVGWAFAGEWLQYTVNVAAAGTYDIGVRVASGGAGGRFHIEVNGNDVTGPIDVPDTGGWDTWMTITRGGITLPSGQQVWRIVMDVDGSTTAVANFNYLSVSSSGATGATLIRQPYLQQVTDHSAIVVWTTRESAAPAVRYSPGSGAVTVAGSARYFPAADTGLPYDFYQYEADLLGLAGATSYTYDVLMNGVDITAGQATFRTAPPSGTGTIRFLAFGDSGTGSAAQRQLATRMTAETFDLALHVGDLAYGDEALEGGGHFNEYDDWVFGIYAPWLRTHPLFPSIGNHDNEVADAWPYRQVFVLPENGATAAYPDHAVRYYSFDYGPVHFVALDTETAFRDDPGRQAAQLAWLDQDLSSTTQPWRIVFFHRSPYSASGGHGSDLDVRQKFAPLFERYGVQLVLSGHDHDYERSIPLREFSGAGPGVTYVVTGGGGAALYPSGSDYWTVTSSSVYHYSRVSVDGCALQVEAVRIDGVVFDQFALNRCTP